MGIWIGQEIGLFRRMFDHSNRHWNVVDSGIGGNQIRKVGRI